MYGMYGMYARAMGSCRGGGLYAHDWNHSRTLRNNVPAGLVVGCKNVKELVPKVRLARFHNESLPSRLGFPGGGEVEAEAEASSDGEG